MHVRWRVRVHVRVCVCVCALRSLHTPQQIAKVYIQM